MQPFQVLQISNKNKEENEGKKQRIVNSPKQIPFLIKNAAACDGKQNYMRYQFRYGKDAKCKQEKVQGDFMKIDRS